MEWNIACEALSFILVLIILVYSYKAIHLDTLKNKLFFWCLLVTLGSIVFNIISTIFIGNYSNVPNFYLWIVTILYFIFTPLMSLMYFYYSVSILYENEKSEKSGYLYVCSAIPYVFYLIIVLYTPFTGSLFNINDGEGYTRGPFISITYTLFYLYSLLSIGFVFYKKRNISMKTMRVLVSFPLIALVVIFIQEMYPRYILTGSAAGFALLIIYLYFQNKEMTLDRLTGLSNRQEFLHMLQERLRNSKDKPFSIIIISLDDFKFINDKFGYRNGDLFLQEVSKYLKSILPVSSLYRYTGDKFIVCLNRFQGVAEEVILTSLLDKFQSRWTVNGYCYILKTSIGIVNYPNVAKDLDSIINGLEHTISIVKKSPKRKSCFLTQDMLVQMNRRKDITEILRESMKNGGFDVYIQPIFSMEERKFVMGEALLRLKKTKFGEIRPAEFIPVAEESGIIIDLTYLVLDKVCKIIRNWIENNRYIKGVTINFSPIQFMQEDLVERVCSIIEKNNIPHKLIKIEVTETTVINNFEYVKKTMKELNKKGIRFCIDDFGVGYSNFHSVLKLPVETIKFDRSLILASIDNEKTAHLMKNFSKGLHDMKVNTLAEGIETKDQALFVEKCGFGYIQGFLYAKPMIPEEAETYFLRANKKVLDI